MNMNTINQPIQNLKELKRQQRILQAHIIEKEMELQQDFSMVKENMSFGKILGKSLRLGMQGAKGLLGSSEQPAIPGGKTSIIGDLLRVGAYQVSALAAQKLSKSLLNIFSRK